MFVDSNPSSLLLLRLVVNKQTTQVRPRHRRPLRTSGSLVDQQVRSNHKKTCVSRTIVHPRVIYLSDAFSRGGFPMRRLRLVQAACLCVITNAAALMVLKPSEAEAATCGTRGICGNTICTGNPEWGTWECNFTLPAGCTSSTAVACYDLPDGCGWTSPILIICEDR
jgi:hypothetical protein